MFEQDEPIRIDKWLWAARFFKTRGLARDAIKGGNLEEAIMPAYHRGVPELAE